MQWSPDGSFFLVPGGELKKVEKSLFCAYAFSRKDVSKPCLAFPMEEPVIITSFCPALFELNEGENSIF
jgi:hypothetical protein